VSDQPIRLVCFDVGGVLIKHRRTWREGCLAAGLPVREGCETPEASARRKEAAHLFATGRIDPAAFYRGMSESTGGLYTPAEIEHIHHCWLGPEYDRVGPVVRRLVEQGRVQTGVLSNTTDPHWARLLPRNGRPPEFPTPSLLSNLHASHLLGHMKPAPEIYAEFERRTGLAGPEILFLEDLPENAAPAAARGWRIAPIDHTRETADQIESALRAHGVLD
jgi:FMN phosphatase YigB (HAD superfamily)